MVLLDRAPLTALAEFGKLVIVFVGGAQVEGVFVQSRTGRCPFDCVQLRHKIRYRCVGMLSAALSD